MDSLLKEYRDVSERIGKLYSDLETLEARRSELERSMGNGHIDSSEAPAKGGYKRDAHAVSNTLAFLKRHFVANKICTIEMLMNEMNITQQAAESRLRKLALPPHNAGKFFSNPSRLEKI